MFSPKYVVKELALNFTCVDFHKPFVEENRR